MYYIGILFSNISSYKLFSGADTDPCLICREPLGPVSIKRMKKECGHHFHVVCEKKWDDVAHDCAACRRPTADADDTDTDDDDE